MTEIQFLLDIIMNNKLSAPVKAKLLARIGEVEQRLIVAQPQARQPHAVTNIAQHTDSPIVNNSAAVQSALQSRQAAMSAALTGEKTALYKAKL